MAIARGMARRIQFFGAEPSVPGKNAVHISAQDALMPKLCRSVDPLAVSLAYASLL